ncbi:hypothetical protein TNCV_3017831 [Trichonephila clavipes]|nr:hypothetical protein TNCV_3017831 [Trichonephila clavipes]
MSGFGGLSEERPSVFKTPSKLVLIYRPNVVGMKGRVDLSQPINRTPDLWCGSTIHYHSILFEAAPFGEHSERRLERFFGRGPLTPVGSTRHVFCAFRAQRGFSPSMRKFKPGMQEPKQDPSFHPTFSSPLEFLLPQERLAIHYTIMLSSSTSSEAHTVLDESRSFFRVHTGYFSNIPKCIKAEFIASWACSQSSVVSSSQR